MKFFIFVVVILLGLLTLFLGWSFGPIFLVATLLGIILGVGIGFLIFADEDY